MGTVTKLHEGHIVAQCPECGKQEWWIHLDGYGLDYTHVTGHECANCGYNIIINVEVIKDEEKEMVSTAHDLDRH